MKPLRSFLAVSAAAALLLAGCSGGTDSQTTNSTSSSQLPVSSTPAPTPPLSIGTSQQTGVQYYTLADVAKHAVPEDCWMAIEGKVYDVSGFGNMHPGGDQVYLGCGKDATKLYEQKPGEGNDHSGRARNMLGRYYIGDLKN